MARRRQAKCLGDGHPDRTAVGEHNGLHGVGDGQGVERRADPYPSNGERLATAAWKVVAGGESGHQLRLLVGDLGERTAGPRADVDLAEPCVEGDFGADARCERRSRGASPRQVAGDDVVRWADVIDKPVGELRGVLAARTP